MARRADHTISRASPTHARTRATRRSGHAVMRAVLGAVLAGVLAGCATETRVIRYRPILSGLPGAEGGIGPDGRSAAESAASAAEVGGMPLSVLSTSQIRYTDDDGRVRLVATTGRDLMIHVYETLRDGERDLFLEQVLSDATKVEYGRRGIDPSRAFDDLLARSDDVVDLFNAMPSGEFTPGVFLTPIGRGQRRLVVSGMAARGLRWTAMDMIEEDGNYRLLWFGRPAPSRR